MDRIDALRAFVRLVETGSFTQAAKDLDVGQPTVSKWVSALEADFGVTLCERTTRSRAITDAGRALYPRAKAIVDQFERAREAAGGEAVAVGGRLSVSVPVVFGRLYVSPLLPAFARAYPDVDLRVSYDDRYVDLVAEGIQVAIRVGAAKDSTFKGVTLGESPRRLVASPAYLAEHGRPRHPKDLAAHRCLRHSLVDNAAIWQFSRGRQRINANVSGRFSSNHSETLRAMAVAGHGIALLADWLVRDDVQSGALRLVLTKFRAPDAPLRLIFPPTGQHSAPARAFTTFLKEHLPAHLLRSSARLKARSSASRQ